MKYQLFYSLRRVRWRNLTALSLLKTNSLMN